MYRWAIILLMGALPAASIAVEFAARQGEADLIGLFGKWFVFWSVGVRLILAGLRQLTGPSFTAETIFGVNDKAALPIVQELGMGNLSIGLLGALSLARASWTIPAAIAGAAFYGLAGIAHFLRRGRNAHQNMAMGSDLIAFVILAGYLVAVLLKPQ